MEITRQTIMNRLMGLPMEILDAELKLMKDQSALTTAKGHLQKAQDDLITGAVQGKVIDGKNEETRKAQMRQHTILEQNDVNKASESFDRQTYEITKLKNELAALRAVCDLLKGTA